MSSPKRRAVYASTHGKIVNELERASRTIARLLDGPGMQALESVEQISALQTRVLHDARTAR